MPGAVEVTMETGDEVYTHSLHGAFCVGAMWRVLDVVKPKATRVTLTTQFVQAARERGGVVPSRVDALKLGPVEKLDKPAIMIITGFVDNVPSEGFLVDGNHRAVARAELGLDFIDCFAMPIEAARDFLVERFLERHDAIVIRDRDNDKITDVVIGGVR